jgi:rhamnulokinase
VNVSVAAVDLGASSGRVLVGEVGPNTLSLHALARFPNDPVRLPDGLHWNAMELYRQTLLGLREAVRSTGGGLASVGVDAWAVDYALLRGDRVLGEPFHYRDSRTAAGVEAVHAIVSREELYERNGLQFLPFNTLYQLAADHLVREADHALLIPDLMVYWLTGEMRTERTNVSTTGFLGVRTGNWDLSLFEQLGVASNLFPALMDPGDPVGQLSPDVADFVHASGLGVTAVGSHDTASAVVGVPMTTDDAAYISCGTWGLVGIELDTPVVTAASRQGNFTNERGVDGRIRFLTNVMGTWLLSETVRTCQRAGEAVSLRELLAQANDVDSRDITIFDVQDPRFIPPGDMSARITSYCEEHDLRPPRSRPAVVRSIVESLAAGFAVTVDIASQLSGRRVNQVHLVGGGSLNTLLCQATANHCGLPVLAGPAEATAIGNVLVQSRAVAALTGDLERLRALVAATSAILRFQPQASVASHR